MVSIVLLSGFGVLSAKDIYQIKIYTLENETQFTAMNTYLEEAYIPALHRSGIKKVGVFKTIEARNQDKNQIIVLIPLISLEQISKLENLLLKDEEYIIKSKDFRNAAFDNPPYKRLESIISSAFSSFPEYKVPDLASTKKDRVYELRSYESATEELHRMKVKMFNDGETQIFIDLGFQPMFFSQVISGANMPNLIYMICHENESAHETNWQAFGGNEKWNEMKVMDIYQNTVSQIDKWMLYPMEYSDM
jgi:hypothetical protein